MRVVTYYINSSQHKLGMKRVFFLSFYVPSSTFSASQILYEVKCIILFSNKFSSSFPLLTLDSLLSNCKEAFVYK